MKSGIRLGLPIVGVVVSGLAYRHMPPRLDIDDLRESFWAIEIGDGLRVSRHAIRQEGRFSIHPRAVELHDGDDFLTFSIQLEPAFRMGPGTEHTLFSASRNDRDGWSLMSYQHPEPFWRTVDDAAASSSDTSRSNQ